jgi:hypothetical protein
MEDTVLLKVVLTSKGQLEVEVDPSGLAPLSLVGIIEQVKLNILTTDTPEVTKTKYDA